MLQPGRPFYKLSGSGNDFVFVDIREEPAGKLEDPEVIKTICARGTGVGADGIVLLGRAPDAALGIRYLNADGSLAALCGNATLCAARLGVELAIAPTDREFTVATDSGLVRARLLDGLPEIDLQPVTELEECFQVEHGAGEKRVGFALVGVPHLTILCEDVDIAPVLERGRMLRHHRSLDQGANVNFVSGSAGEWKIRTYERGVEEETLACGTGAVASALLLSAWGEATGPISLETKSGRTLTVRHRSEAGRLLPSLSGEARIVFVGQFGELLVNS